MCARSNATCARSCLQLPNDMKLIPLYVMDSILKNVRPQSVYSGLVARNLTRVMGYAFMSVDNAIKPKFIKLLKTWEDNKVFSEHKILEIRDTMMLMLTNGGIFPEHLNHGGAGPQMGGHAHMASGPMDVEASYGVPHNAYHNQHPGSAPVQQQLFIGGGMESNGRYGSHQPPGFATEVQEPTARVQDSSLQEAQFNSAPRTLDLKELLRCVPVGYYSLVCVEQPPLRGGSEGMFPRWSHFVHI